MHQGAKKQLSKPGLAESLDVQPPSKADELLVSALDLFATRSYASVSIKEIASASGVNAALIYYYFKNKEHLFQKTIEMSVTSAFDHFRAMEKEWSSPPDLLSGWLENHIELHPIICKLVKISLDYASTTKRSSGIDQSIFNFYNEEEKVLASAINSGIDSGIFEPVDADDVSALISTFLDGVMVRSVIISDFDYRAAILEFKGNLWRILGYKH